MQIPGIGRATTSKLKAAGIASTTALHAVPETELCALLGEKEGRLVYGLVRGVDPEPVVASGLAKTMSNEDALGACTDINRVMTSLEKLIGRLLLRIDDERVLYNRLPRTLRLSVVPHSYHHRISRQMRVEPSFFTKAS